MGADAAPTHSVAKRDFSRETVFTNQKAGMHTVDKERVQQVVYEMSKNSAHFDNEQRKQAKVLHKIERMKQQLCEATTHELQSLKDAADRRLLQLESERDLSRIWLHVDLDAFYASVEERDNPDLVKIPVAGTDSSFDGETVATVGGIGMICTANYQARKFGVRAAMPGFIARRLCPELRFVKPNFEKYQAAAAEARRVFAEIDPAYVSRGLDEASLDATDYCCRAGRAPAEVAAYVRAEVVRRTQLTCSVGIAANTTLAKICSDMNKPNGQYELGRTRDAILAFLADLPVRKVPGVGRVTEQMLAAFGVERVSQIHEQRAEIACVFSEISTDFFLRASLGLGSTEHPEEPSEGDAGRKGISCERTFAPIESRRELEQKATDIAASLARDVAREGLAGKCVTLKLKQSDFKVRTRSVTLPTYISSQPEIEAAALGLLVRELPVRIRLMGIRLSAFRSAAVSPSQRRLAAVLRQAPACVTGPAALSAQRDADATAAPSAEAAATFAAAPVAHALQPVIECQASQTPRALNGASWEAAFNASGAITAASAGVTRHLEQSGIAWASESSCGNDGHEAVAAHQMAARDALRGGRTSENGGHAWAPRRQGESEDQTCGDGAHGPCKKLLSPGELHESVRGKACTSSAGAPRGPDGEECVTCRVCGRAVARGALQEHMDWHIAAKLNAEINGAGVVTSEGRQRPALPAVVKGPPARAEKLRADGVSQREGLCTRKRKGILTSASHEDKPHTATGLKRYFRMSS